MGIDTRDYNVGDLAKSVEALEKDLNTLRAKLRRDEKYALEREKPLPETLYHATTRNNALQLLREGLDPSKLIFENKEVVCLSDDIDYALWVASKTQNIPIKNLVVIEVETKYLTPSRIDKHLREADQSNPNPLDAAAMHEVHYEATISPNALRIISKKELIK